MLNSLKILGYTYRVECESNQAALGAAGRVLITTQLIQIANDLAPQIAQSTLLHEIIEAIDYHLALELPHHQIMILETALYQVLVDNGIDLSPLFNCAIKQH